MNEFEPSDSCELDDAFFVELDVSIEQYSTMLIAELDEYANIELPQVG